MTPTPDRPASPAGLPRWLTVPLSAAYRAEIGRRNRRFDRGLGVTRLDRPVISVGNLSAGGTGKTPVVRWVVGRLVESGHRPVVAMRGYKAPAGGASDEEREHREAMPGVAVVARPDRIAGLRALFATPEGAAVDCVVLDDGFQHRRLARDLDIVLIDASRPPDRDALLPSGFLREPEGSLDRAGAVVLTHAEMVDQREIERIGRSVGGMVRPGVPLAVAEHRWTGIRVFCPPPAPDAAGVVETNEPVGWLAGKRVIGVCAIGHPDGFFGAIGRAGAERRAELALPDHDPFRSTTIEQMVRLAQIEHAAAIVVTAKDWTKLSGRGVSWPCPVAVPTLGIGWRSGEMALRDRVIHAAAGATGV